MTISFSKLNPTCYNILPISWSEDPKTSLSTIGINFSALDTSLCNLYTSAENLWSPMFSVFQNVSANWESVYNTVISNSACWQSTYLTVRTLSAHWLTPITIVYPNVIKKADYSIASILTWVKSSFPISSQNCTNYINGQLLKVYTLRYAIEQQQITCRCAANGGTIYINYIGAGSRPVQCNCTCTPGRVEVSDRYVDDIKGVEFIVQNGEWVYFKDLH